LNYLQIFANPGQYILKPIIENYNDKIEFHFDDINVEIKECNDNQIKFIDKYGIQHCENPICKESCPINKSAVCKPYYEENINDINMNICECLSGWTGENCEEKVFIDYRYYLIFL